jgi:glutamate synthase (NADPH/NADH) large chain
MGTASPRECTPGLRTHDSCGFGLIADLDDRQPRHRRCRAHRPVAPAHRGAVGADGRSGDGCGLLIHRPESFLRTIAAEAGLQLGQQFAAGMVFLPTEADSAMVARDTLAAALVEQGLRVAGWRVVPVSREDCGPIALAGMPCIEQVFVEANAGRSLADLQRALFLARRAAEKALASFPEFYVVTLSATTLGYKAMVLPDALPAVFPDLARADLASSVVVFHQRFSTNTWPAWPALFP